jgi:hypothetical protein
VENLVYATSVIGMVVVGLLVVVATVLVAVAVRWWIAAALLGVVVAGVAALRLLRGTRPLWRERLASLRLTVAGF